MSRAFDLETVSLIKHVTLLKYHGGRLDPRRWNNNLEELDVTVRILYNDDPGVGTLHINILIDLT